MSQHPGLPKAPGCSPLPVQPPGPGPLPLLTTRVEEALPRAHLWVLLGQRPLGPAEALGREEQAVATLHELPEQLGGAARQNHVIAGQRRQGTGWPLGTSVSSSAAPTPFSRCGPCPHLPVHKHDDHIIPVRILLHFLLQPPDFLSTAHGAGHITPSPLLSQAQGLWGWDAEEDQAGQPSRWAFGTRLPVGPQLSSLSPLQCLGPCIACSPARYS